MLKQSYIDTVLFQAIQKMALIGYNISLEEDEGNDVDVLYNQGKLGLLYVRTLQRDFNNNLTDIQKRAILNCLIKTYDINDFPAAPSGYLNPLARPNVLLGVPGTTGSAGASGADGTDANIDVVLADGENQLTLVESVVSGVKTYTLSYTAYAAPVANITVTTSPKTYEIGRQLNISFNVTATEGSLDITGRAVTAPSGVTLVNTSFTDTEAVTVNDITASTVFTMTVTDGQTTDSDSDNVYFYYPFFTGSSPDVLTPAQVYSTFDKTLKAKSSTSQSFNFEDEYIYHVYHSSHGLLDRILDGNGFNVTDSFTRTTISITSTGLENNYTQNFYQYKLTNLSDVPNQTFQFIF